MDRNKLLQIKSELRAKGIFWTDSQIRAYQKKVEEENQGVSQPTSFQPAQDELPNYASLSADENLGVVGTAKAVGENVYDALGAGLWSALDNATFGAAGYGLKAAIGDKEYQEFLEERYDTIGGKIGGGIGSIAGFMVPMTGTAKALSVGFRGGKALLRGKKAKEAIKAGRLGKSVLNPTTREIQKAAANKLINETSDIAIKQGAKGLTQSEATKIAIDATDEVVGFAQQTILGSKTLGKMFKQGPAYQMEHSIEFANNAKKMLAQTLPERLGTALYKRGITLKGPQLKKLSDEMAEMVTKQPFNQIETALMNRFSSKITQGAASVLAGTAQEAVQYGIVATAFDAMQYSQGDLDYKAKSFGEKTLQNLFVGGIFGPVKHLTGGSSRGLFEGVGKFIGLETRKINKKIANMGLKEALSYAKLQKQTNSSALISITKNGKNIILNDRQIGRNSKFVTQQDLPSLKQALIGNNTALLKRFRWGKGKMGEGYLANHAKDIALSFPRMAIGGSVFAMEAMIEGEWDKMTPADAAMNIALGMGISKSYRPLFRQTAVKTGFFYPGERPYYYNTDLQNVVNSMNNARMGADHIKDMVKEFDGNLFTDYLAKNPVKEVDDIIDTLIEGDVVYDASAGNIEPDNTKAAVLPNNELMSLLADVFSIMKARNIKLNPNATKESMESALSKIKSLEAQSFDGALDSRSNIRKAIFEGTKVYWNKLSGDIFDSFRQQMEAITGDPNYINEKGEFNRFVFSKKDIEKLREEGDTESLEAIDKLQKLMDNFISLNKAKMTDQSVIDGNEIEIALGFDALDNLKKSQITFEHSLGSEFYGESLNLPIDMNDKSMWSHIHQVDTYNSVERVLDVLDGNMIEGVNEADLKSIQSDINNLLSSDSNTNPTVITSDPTKIKIDAENFTGDADEQRALQEFLNTIWELKARGGSNTNHTKSYDTHTVRLTDIKRLKERLVKIGMPDMEMHLLDSRMQTWIEKASEIALDRQLGGLDIDKGRASAVKRLLMNGVIIAGQSPTGRSTNLQIPNAINKESVARALDVDKESLEVKLVQDAYNQMVKDLGNSVQLIDDLGSVAYTSDQIASIMSSSGVLNIGKVANDIKETRDYFDNEIIAINEKIKLLSDQQKDITIPDDDKTQIKALLEHSRRVKELLGEEQLRFAKSYAGDVEVSRAAATLFFSNNYKENGKTIYDYIKDAKEEGSNIDTITDKIRFIQSEIANKISERVDHKLDFYSRQQEDILRRKHEEIEGIMRKDSFKMNPDRFMQKYLISISDISNAQTFNSASEAMQEIYSKKGAEALVNKLFKLTKNDKISADNVVRAEVASIVGLFERRFNVKKLVVDMDSGKGKFTKTEISKGFLTDAYNEILGPSAGDMVIVSSDFLEGGRLKSTATDQNGLLKIQDKLNSPDFYEIRDNAINQNLKQMKDGVWVDAESYEGIELGKDFIADGFYLVGIDENINIALPKSSFNDIANSFIRWMEDHGNSKYTKEVSKNLSNAKTLMDQLNSWNNILKELKKSQTDIDIKEFEKRVKADDAIFTMFNVMYAEKIDKNWLQEAYISNSNALKTYKYKRLAQNQGYKRNSNTKKQYIKEIYEDSGNEYIRNLVNDYTDKEFSNVLIIDDTNTSSPGELVNNFITDNRSVAEANLKMQYDNGEISKENYLSMLKTLDNSNSLNAESANAMTAVRREELDYLLVLNGEADLIGESSGQKPVGLSSYTDDNGIAHVFYNKTHYFYDSRLDEFFAENPSIGQVAFKSGAKKTSKIDTINPKSKLNPKTKNREVENLFKALEPTKIDGKETLTTFINKLRNIDETHESVMPAKFDQMLSGTVYGKAKDAKVMKQFDNWTSETVQLDMYEYARADMAQKFGEVQINLYNAENTQRARQEAMSFINSSANESGSLNTEVPNASVASLWIEGGGIPFSEISKNLYDSIVKKRYIDDAGVFDGYTDAGGVPVLRANLDNDLNIPVYDKAGNQVKFGEANIAPQYLNRSINFKSQFGAGTKTKTDKIKRPKYKDKSSMSLVFALDNRDVLVDVKTGDLYDSKNPKGKLSDKEYSNIKSDIEAIKVQLGKTDKSIETWQDLFYELKTNPSFKSKKIQLGIMSMPAPRTGPHDAMVVKIKGLTNAKDGGIMELNSYDVTMRGQRDYDTDKLPFYMDIPFSAMKESAMNNGQILEPQMTSDKVNLELDMFSNTSFRDYNQEINKFKRYRGPIVKMQRKISYAMPIFEKLGGLDLGDGTKIVINTGKTPKQKLVNSTQEALDIYAGLPRTLQDMSKWSQEILFGTDKKHDDGFFAIQDAEGNLSKIDNIGHKLIIEKTLQDYGRLLSLESNIYETGEAKSARYKDMYSYYHEFKNKYKSDAINYNFYHYMVARGHKDVADDLFFSKDPQRKDKDVINPILNNLSLGIENSSSPFLKSLKKIAENDELRVTEVFSPSNDHFNAQIDKLLGKERAQALMLLQLGEKAPDMGVFDAKNNLINDMWNGFSKIKEHEKRMVQLNTIESQIRRSEYNISNEARKSNPDQAYIEMEKQDISIKRGALEAITNKMSIEPGVMGQKIIKNTKDPITVYRGAVAIRHKKSGDLIRYIKADPKQEPYYLKKNEVAIENPVILKPIVEKEALDGAAFAYSTLGYMSRISENDIQPFRDIVRNARKEIKSSMKSMFDKYGYTDWQKHEADVSMVISKSLQKVINLAYKDSQVGLDVPTVRAGFIRELPKGKETYGIDFLMSLLTPDFTGNINEYHFSPKSGNFLHAVRVPKKSVINAVFKAMDDYQVHENHADFVKEFAKVHGAFFDAIVGGRGYHQAMGTLANTSFEGALIKNVMEKSLNSPFVSRENYKDMKEYFDSMPELDSEFYEYYRQIVQDGAITDPMTAFSLRRQIIEDPLLGEQAYNQIFMKSRGQILFDGISSKRFGYGKGEGQLLADMLVDRKEIINRNLSTNIPGDKNAKFKSGYDEVLGYQNNKGGC